jgi:1-acyl-sn-glycerol-3-phosphate acyltransferase
MRDAGTRPDDDAAQATLLSIVDALAAELRPGRPPRPARLDSQLDRDLGFDSLGRVELIARLEQHFEVALGERVAVEAETPHDLLRAVAAAPVVASASPPRPQPVLPPARSGAGLVLPEDAQTWLDVLALHEKAHAGAVAIRFFADAGDGPELTYGGLLRDAKAIAAGLLTRGLERGEAVALMLPTSADYFRSFAGIWLAGGVPVPIYPPFRPAQLAEHVHRQVGILDNCRAAYLVTTGDLGRVGRLLREQVPSLRSVLSPEDLATEASVPVPHLAPDDTALLQYTSGSTAAPKGVVLSHANLLANVRAIGDAVQVRPDDVTVSWLPLYHDMGLIGAWLGTLYHAVPLVLMSPLAFIGRPARWLEAIHRHRGTITAAPNFAFDLCTRRIRDEELAGLDLSCLRAVYNGAEAVSPTTMERFIERFSTIGFRREAMMPVYGLAESSVALTFPPLGRAPIVDTVDRRLLARSGRAEPMAPGTTGTKSFVACGRPLPLHEVRIVDEQDRELPDRQEGHIQFKGPSATRGYLRNPEATARLRHGDWLDTGDLGYVAGGDLYVTGRAKDIIIKAGRNIYPEELEEAVGAIDGIRAGNVAAFGIADEAAGGEALVVLAETRKTREADRERLVQAIDALALDLAGMPADRVVLCPPNTVLKTSSGKIRRDACRQLYERGAVGRERQAVWRQVLALKLEALGPRLTRLRRNAGAVAFAAWGWTLVALLAPLGWLAVLVLPSVESRWAAARAILRLMARLSFTPLTVEGVERLPKGSVVLVANHASYLDGFALLAALPRPVAFVAKAELADHWLTGTILRRIGAVFVERFDKARSIAEAREMTARAGTTGGSLLFFPEGTFDRMPGLLPFHMGAFLVAVRSRLPLVPVALRGTRSMLRSDVWFPRAGSIAVVIGAPLQATGEGDDWAEATALRDAARSFIARASGEPGT